MHNKKNITIMILLIMLSFAIVSEVSAASAAEADGTGSNPAITSVDMTRQDFASESNDKFMQNPVNDHADDFKSHNERESFNNAPQDLGDRNETSYEHNMDSKFDDDKRPQFNESEADHFDRFEDRNPMEFNQTDAFEPRGDMPLDNGSMFKPEGDRPWDNGSMFKPEGESFDIKEMDFNMPDNSSMKLRDNNFTNPFNGELMDDVVSNLIGLNNIAPKIKDDKDRNMSNPKPDDAKNASATQGPGEKNSSSMWSDSIKDKKDSKVVKKSTAKKVTKKSTKKAKVSKKKKAAKKAKANKRAKKGMAKL